MNTEHILTSKFEEQKKNFTIDGQLDRHIKKFILNLNKNENIVTIFSCEGMDDKQLNHSHMPYFGFNVNKQTWNLLWTQVIPELMMKIEIQVSTNCYEEVIFIHYPNNDKFKFWKVVFEVFGKYFIEK